MNVVATSRIHWEYTSNIHRLQLHHIATRFVENALGIHLVYTDCTLYATRVCQEYTGNTSNIHCTPYATRVCTLGIHLVYTG